MSAVCVGTADAVGAGVAGCCGCGFGGGGGGGGGGGSGGCAGCCCCTGGCCGGGLDANLLIKLPRRLAELAGVATDGAGAGAVATATAGAATTAFFTAFALSGAGAAAEGAPPPLRDDPVRELLLPGPSFVPGAPFSSPL